ncbi:hypothetical protein ACP6EK_03945 [Candidatus Caldatribacterium sp. SIUC1]|uniref:hypothetical protein n=1 Tax=Candidatus Caldatribacterium sp. SIUC1 TaxID=3418365 RepID=UPI003F68C559
MPRENLKTLKVASPGDLIAIGTSGVVPFLGRCISNSPPETLSPGGPIPPSILKPRNLPRVFLEELRKVPLSGTGQEYWRE